MDKRILIVGILALGLITSFGISRAYAYRGDASVVGPYHTQERQSAMEKVMEEKDYEGWKELMTEGDRQPGVVNKIESEEEFNQFANAYELSKEGKTEEAKVIREELGLGDGEQRRNRHQNREANFVDENGNGECDRRE